MEPRVNTNWKQSASLRCGLNSIHKHTTSQGYFNVLNMLFIIFNHEFFQKVRYNLKHDVLLKKNYIMTTTLLSRLHYLLHQSKILQHEKSNVFLCNCLVNCNEDLYSTVNNFAETLQNSTCGNSNFAIQKFAKDDFQLVKSIQNKYCSYDLYQCPKFKSGTHSYRVNKQKEIYKRISLKQQEF